MSLVVPDASVILKWVLPEGNEPLHAQAGTLRQQFSDEKLSFAVPSLWRFEVGNLLARKYPDDAVQDLLDLQDMGMHEPAPSQTWVEHTCRLAQEYSVAFYDAAYHALAIVESGTLVTADERYLRAVGGQVSICHLADWRL